MLLLIVTAKAAPTTYLAQRHAPVVLAYRVLRFYVEHSSFSLSPTSCSLPRMFHMCNRCRNGIGDRATCALC